LGWLEVELTSKENELLGAKKAQSYGILTSSLPKVSLLCQHCPLLICIRGCGICSQHGACSEALTNADAQISKYNSSFLGKTTSISSMALAFQP
jgi:hypothetical protein